MSQFDVGNAYGTSFAPHFNGQSNNAVVQEAYYLMLTLLAQQGGLVARLVFELGVAQKGTNAATGILAMLQGNLTDAEINKFANFYEHWINDPGQYEKWEGSLSSILNNPHFKALFHKLYEAIKNLQNVENSGGDKKAAMKAVKRADENLRWGASATPPTPAKSGYSPLKFTQDQWDVIHDRFEKELLTAKTFASITQGISSILYQKAASAVNTIIGTSRYISAMVKRGYDVNQFIENNMLS